MQDFTLKISDLLIIFATLLGPVLAVQAQKAIERYTEARSRKEKVFYALMSTRVSRLSTDHIQALNSIPLVFGTSKTFFVPRVSRSEKAVLDAWEAYQDILNTRVEELSPTNFENWVHRRDDEFRNLLLTMSNALGFHFNKIQISKGAYAPIAQATLEQNQQDILGGLAKLFRDGHPIPMHVVSIDQDEHLVDLQRKLNEKILKSLDSDGIPISVLNPDKKVAAHDE